MFILFHDDPDPAMRYEGLARTAFECNAWGGPKNIAHQGFYNEEFVPDITDEGTSALKLILEALIIQSNEKNIKEELSELKNSLTENMDQLSGIELIDFIIKILQEKE